MNQQRTNRHDECAIDIINQLLEHNIIIKEMIPQIKNVIDLSMDKYDIFNKETSLMKSDIFEMVQRYLMMRQIDGLSKKTLKLYGERLYEFSKHMRKPINHVTTNDMRSYIVFISHNKSKTTINTIISILKTFFQWVYSEEYVPRNPMAKINLIPVPKRLRHALNEEELEILRQSCIDPIDKALIEFFVSTGCRLDETINVKLSDINWDSKSLYVIGKGDKQRRVYFSSKCKLYLQQYIQTRNDNIEYLFVHSRSPYDKFGHRGIQTRIKKLGERSNIGKPVFPHLLRHTFGMSRLNHGMSLNALQHIMGHSNPNTTQIYATLNDNNIQHEYSISSN